MTAVVVVVVVGVGAALVVGVSVRPLSRPLACLVLVAVVAGESVRSVVAGAELIGKVVSTEALVVVAHGRTVGAVVAVVVACMLAFVVVIVPVLAVVLAVVGVLMVETLDNDY